MPAVAPAPLEKTLETPATAYARMDRTECLEELGRRGVAFSEVPEARGVLAPVRLLAPMHGVTFRHTARLDLYRRSLYA